VTCVALAAVTVKTEEAPATIDFGLAVIVTLGAVTAAVTVTVAVAVAVVVPAGPVADAV
jgi:hypothetical protein